MRYYIIAGEASGDLHGSNLMKGLAVTDREADFRFWGGDLMNAVGGTLVRHYRDGAVMGATEVLAKAGKILGNLSFCKKDILSWSPDAVILIDYPGFNMKIAKFCHEKGIKVFYYIAPKTWASREGRNRKLKAWVDRLFIVFPFEIPYFTEKGIPFTYKGNPLIDAVDNAPSGTPPCPGKYIAMLAGSRKGEISRMMPVYMQVADRLRATSRYRDYTFVVAGAPSRCMDDYAAAVQGRDFVKVTFGNTYDVLRYADAAVINSGTASLEAALIGTPQVVCYRMSAVTAFIARKILKVLDNVKFISLGNLIIGRLAFRELIQEEFNADSVTGEVQRLIEDREYREKMISDYSDIRNALGGKGASEAVAKAMIETLNNNQHE